MLYIRRKDSPLIIKAFGQVSPGGLGTFDPLVYEEISGDLPKDWQQEVVISPIDKIKSIFQKAILEKPSLMTASVQKDLLKSADIIERALNLGLNEAASEAIREPAIPVELESYRIEMLAAVTELKE